MEPSSSSPKIWDSFKWVFCCPLIKSRSFSTTTTSLIFFLLFIFTLLFTPWLDFSNFTSKSMPYTMSIFNKNNNHNYTKREEYILKCTSSNMTIKCPSNYPPKSNNQSLESNRTCPDYFRWIHEDLKTWKKQGISEEMVDSLKDVAHFRLVIVNGTAYVKEYRKAFQTRDVFTLWGILQLLKLYPGRLPDLDLVFQCHDQSSIKKTNYNGNKAPFAPPQFHYCGDDSTLDIIFPDWSFWGWPEVNIKPWVPLEKDIEEGNKIKNWSSREPFAFWKGNLYTGARHNLGKCNSKNEWNAEIINQDWGKEVAEGFKNSDISKQCVHRYKIYMEGNAWSVSEKYILACDSMTLLINPIYYDFFSRSLIPLKHYWPVNPKNLCKSIKFAVNWGNKNTHKAQEIGKEGSKFIFEELKLENVYDYMFHVLNEYAKLLKYKPSIPEGSIELCSERFACSPKGLETADKIETMVHKPSTISPCQLPPPYDRKTLQSLRTQKANIKKQVQIWEKGNT
ncbi:unnamed protein product [Amaranthus hypochondriacus]